MEAPTDGVLPPSDPTALAKLPESTQTILSRAVFHKRLREALREDDYREKFVEAPNIPRADAGLNAADRDMLFNRRLLLALLRPGAKNFLRMRPADEPFCPQQLGAAMMSFYLGFYAYTDSAGPYPALCGHCGKYLLDRRGIHSIACCQTR